MTATYEDRRVHDETGDRYAIAASEIADALAAGSAERGSILATLALVEAIHLHRTAVDEIRELIEAECNPTEAGTMADMLGRIGEQVGLVADKIEGA